MSRVRLHAMAIHSGSSSPRSPWTSPLAVALFVVAALLLSLSATRIIIKAHTLHAERQVLEAKVRELEQEKRDLEASLSSAASPDVVERLAKEKLDMKNPGEEVVVVEPARASTASSSPASSFGERFLPGWMRNFFDFFGH